MAKKVSKNSRTNRGVNPNSKAFVKVVYPVKTNKGATGFKSIFLHKDKVADFMESKGMIIPVNDESDKK
jgi:hypothetical protein